MKRRPQMKLDGSLFDKTKKDHNPFDKFHNVKLEPSGKLDFGGTAVIHASGVDFSNGNSYKINMEELQVQGEIGKGNYGCVHKAFHKPTKVAMAMKEIHLELEQSKLNNILMELDILHKSQSEFIVEFYGAFFIESCVYYCMEYMDAGSLDRFTGFHVPQNVLSKMAFSIASGLRFLKDELQIMHRDIKPTNVLVNGKGQVKLCDFGVSGQLIQSMAKTNIGCQNYMAPERIASSNAVAYSVASDVWSFGLTLLEIGAGKYPFPAENYGSPFAQLQAIVSANPPIDDLLKDKNYDEEFVVFIRKCLNKEPLERISYGQMFEEPFIVKYLDQEIDMVGWVQEAVTWKASQKLKK